MTNDFGTIGQLLNPVLDHKAPVSKLNAKMKDLDLDEIEKNTQINAKVHGWEYLSLLAYPFDEDAVRQFTFEETKSLNAVVLAMSASALKIATSNPSNKALSALLSLRFSTHTVRYVLVSPKSLTYAFAYYEHLPRMREASKGVEVTEDMIAKYRPFANNLSTLSASLSSSPTSELIAALIAVALESRASDIHIEPSQDSIQFRFRIDGVLHDIATLPLTFWDQIISRIKLVSKLKINITNQPQDGRFTIILSNDTVDVRVSTLPVGHGESVVMRILRSSSAGLSFEALGFTGNAKEKVMKELKRPNGMIVTTGPTGSGKTTTLYAMLNTLNTPGTKIITLEDPIEYHLKGINQSQIDEKAGYTFAQGLRSILRQDPDIIMVGEMRDAETVDTGINAALTGHLVLSTLHTNNALEALPRFLSLNAQPFLLAPALHCVIGQRLVRVLCECKQLATLDDATMSNVRAILTTMPEGSHEPLPLELRFWGPKGCPLCKQFGYKGMIGIYEVLVMSQELEQAVDTKNLSPDVLQGIAKKQGMLTMAQDGMLKALSGITSVEEVLRVSE